MRDAITTANSDAASGTSDTITFNASLNGSTITLSQGVLELSGSGSGTITINGGNQIAVSGNSSYEVFRDPDSGVSALLTGLTIEGGFTTSGGGVRNAGTLTVEQLFHPIEQCLIRQRQRRILQQRHGYCGELDVFQ